MVGTCTQRIPSAVGEPGVLFLGGAALEVEGPELVARDTVAPVAAQLVHVPAKAQDRLANQRGRVPHARRGQHAASAAAHLRVHARPLLLVEVEEVDVVKVLTREHALAPDDNHARRVDRRRGVRPLRRRRRASNRQHLPRGRRERKRLERVGAGPSPPQPPKTKSCCAHAGPSSVSECPFRRVGALPRVLCSAQRPLCMSCRCRSSKQETSLHPPNM